MNHCPLAMAKRMLAAELLSVEVLLSYFSAPVFNFFKLSCLLVGQSF